VVREQELAARQFGRAMSLLELGDLAGAEHLLRESLSLSPKRLSLFVNLSHVLNLQSKFHEAFEVASRGLLHHPDSADLVFNLGTAALGDGIPSAARGPLERISASSPNLPQIHRLLAQVYDRCGDLPAALRSYESVVSLDPSDHGSIANAGAIANDLRDYKRAHALTLRALSMVPESGYLISNLGVALLGLGKHEEAVSMHQRCVQLLPLYAEGWFNLGSALNKLRRFEDAKSAVQRGLDLKPESPVGWSNLGAAYAGLRRFDRAIECQERALKIDGSYSAALANIGGCLSLMGRAREAIGHYERFVLLDDSRADVWQDMGDCHLEIRNFESAIRCYERSADLGGEDNLGFASALYARMFIHDWHNFEQSIVELRKRLQQGDMCVHAFASLGLLDAPEMHRKLAEAIQLRKLSSNSTAKAPLGDESRPDEESLQTHQRLTVSDSTGRRTRIGYFSADFNDHAVSRLCIGLWEAHNKDSYEIHAFSFRQIPDSSMGKRIVEIFDRVHSVSELSDDEVAELSRKLGIDIAVDLSGFTSGCRPEIFSHEPAPVVFNFLGYPGTLGGASHHYIVADSFIIPEGFEGNYSEKIIRLDISYQPNDPTREVEVMPIPEMDARRDRFKFGCFNNSYKITPDVFDTWLEILASCSGSDLYLLESNPSATLALLARCSARGVDQSRLIFLPRAPLGVHLYRTSLLDVFLDTAPYNAHTTASDALWVGVPVLTLPGRSFASRVAGSLLTHMGLGWCVANSRAEYLEKARQLYSDTERLASLKSQIGFRNARSPLFDSARYAKSFEAAVSAAHTRAVKGLPPADINIKR
jgi:protein O-GlcNAc transferase